MKTVKRGIVSLTVLLMFLLSTIFIYEAMIQLVAFTTATISVDPSTSRVSVGQNFTININISNVADLYGWEFRLNWTATILDAKNVSEGPFLKHGGSTFFTFEINNTEGYALVDCTRLGAVPGVSGNGVLATVEFYVEVAGESLLDLYDTILVSSQEQSIPHTSIDGNYYTPIYDVAIIDLVASETTVLVTAANQGTETETFDVSTYYTLLADPLIATQTLTLTSGANTTLTFPWTPPGYGRYEIRAEATQVPGEIDIADNTRVTTINIGYRGGRSNSPILNWVILGFGLISAVWVIPSKKRRPQALQWVSFAFGLLFDWGIIVPESSNDRSNFNNSTNAIAHNLPNSASNLWSNSVSRLILCKNSL